MEDTKDLFKHIAVSVALPELFYNFRVFNRKSNEEIFPLVSKYEEKYFINGWKIDNWQFDRMIKIYENLSNKKLMKITFEELLERLENKHFENVDVFAKKIYDLIINDYIHLSDFYDEENYLCVNLERFNSNEMDWVKLKEVVSMVTITLDNLLTTYLINPPSRKIKINIKGLEKLKFDDNTKNKIKNYIRYYSYLTSIKLNKERENTSDIFEISDFSEEELNMCFLKSEIKLYGLRNEINFCFNPEIIETESFENEIEEIQDTDFYPFSSETNQIEKMAPLVKGIKTTKDICPMCSSKDIIYEAGCMCCLSCGWSACTIS